MGSIGAGQREGFHEPSVSPALCWEEYDVGVEGFFLLLWDLLGGIFMFADVLHTLLFHHWSAAPCHISMHSLLCVLHTLNTSWLLSLPLRLAYTVRRLHLLADIGNWHQFIALASPISSFACASEASALILCLLSCYCILLQVLGSMSCFHYLLFRKLYLITGVAPQSCSKISKS